MRVDLILLGGTRRHPPTWDLGTVHGVDALPGPVARAEAVVTQGDADLVLHWSERFPLPSAMHLAALAAEPDEVWHAGLTLGTAGLPRVMDHLAPTWMLNADPPAAIEATSWRISLDACLSRTDVLRTYGGTDPRFDSLGAAALELGHRWIQAGASLRHVPGLVPAAAAARPPTVSVLDDLRFARSRFGDRWLAWAAARLFPGRPVAVTAALARLLAEPSPGAPRRHARPPVGPPEAPAPSTPRPSVTVLVPTIERYPYLRVVLDQLRGQTEAAHQIVVIDQTPLDDRDPAIGVEYGDLPLDLLHLEIAGQSTARNAGLAVATGDTVLFIDDDDEIEPDLIERHVDSLLAHRIDVSSGVVHEPESGPLPPEFLIRRVSDTFPTNNSLVSRDALTRSGWFDEAYDRGERADHDLGMRLYLSGHRMLLEPTIDVLHHHAPRGGLRVHNARAVTQGAARSSISGRPRLSPSQIYLWNRYFSADQAREAALLHIAGNVFGSGPAPRRLARAVVQLLAIPEVRREIAASTAEATELGHSFPRIPGRQLPFPASTVATGA